MRIVPALLFVSIALTGCGEPITKKDLRKAQFWQRSSASDAAYQQGPKVQEMLNRDIANCVSSLKEMERLEMVHHGIPADSMGRVLNKDEEAFAAYEEPDRFGGLNLELGNYHDFEGCMLSKGWERTNVVPYSVASRSRETYLRSIGRYNEYYETERREAQDGEDD